MISQNILRYVFFFILSDCMQLLTVFIKLTCLCESDVPKIFVIYMLLILFTNLL